MAPPKSNDLCARRSVRKLERASRKGSRYLIRWVDPLTGRIRQLGYPTKAERDAAASSKFLDLNGAWLGGGAIKLVAWGEAIPAFERSLSGCTPHYQDGVARTLLRFAQICQPKNIHGINRMTIERYLAERRRGKASTRPPAEGALCLEAKHLKAFLEWCVSVNFLAANPMRKMRLPAAADPVVRPPTEEDILRILRACGDPGLRFSDRQAWYVLVLLGWVTGIRQEALLRVRISSQDVNANHIELAGDDDRGIGLLFTRSAKTGKFKISGLPAPVNDRIAGRIADLPAGEEFLLPEHLRTRFQDRQWHRLVRYAKVLSGGKPLQFKALRAASGTQAAVARAEQAAADQLDHSDLRVTRRHYLQMVQVARAVAQHQAVPPLPPLPRYAPPNLRS